MPQPLPFDGIELEPNGSTQYVSKIKADQIIRAAKAELKENRPESYKIVILALLAGLRKGEIDSLLWESLDKASNTIHIATTEHGRVKSVCSESAVDVDPELLQEVASLRTDESFVIGAGSQAQKFGELRSYRCETHFQDVIGWLRGKGVKTNKPLHELRKEFGAILTQKHGIYAGMRALRHSDISTTARHYVDKKSRISVGLGKELVS